MQIRFQAFRSYFHRLLTWQNSEKLCIVLEPETDLGAKASKYMNTNTTILDAEILTQIFPGILQFQLLQSDVTHTVCNENESFKEQNISL